MNLFTNDLENLPEPHTPRFAYHCNEHPSLKVMEYEHPHFRETHKGKSVHSYRIRCKGSLCAICL